jgi:hypothetical protein
MEIGPGSPRPALTRVTVWVTAPLCKGGAGVRGFSRPAWEVLLLTLMPGGRLAPRGSSFFYTTLAYVVLLNWARFMHATELQINRDVPHGKDILISTDKYRMAMYLTMALAHWWMCPHSWTSVWGCGGPLHKAKLVEKGRASHLSHGLQCNDGVHPELSHPTLCSFKMRVQNNMLTLMQSVP